MKDFDGFTVSGDDWRLTIQRDDTPDNPRNWDNLGEMLCWGHGRGLGDTMGWRDERDFLEDLYPDPDGEYGLEDLQDRFLKDTDYITLPLYLRETGAGIQVSTSGGQDMGWLWVHINDLKGEDPKRAREILQGEIDTYNLYLAGECYGFTLERGTRCDCCGHIEWKHDLSCWGFLGEPDDALDAMSEHWPDDVSAAVLAAWTS